ncbi:MAG: hypothetical protein VB078_00240 [Clostridiaceae bacterium]|nr:hypothetical protein [Clostridiaceae bacterium]
MKKQDVKALISWAGLLILGIILYRLGCAAAYAERGYHATGAELALLVLPFGASGAWKYIVKPYIAWAKEIYKSDEERESENVL